MGRSKGKPSAAFSQAFILSGKQVEQAILAHLRAAKAVMPDGYIRFEYGESDETGLLPILVHVGEENAQ